ncbi:MAG TPA: ribokinase [Methylomirabilota bacterium]|nr:ribokinase [Methylomirabilota bacterium]
MPRVLIVGSANVDFTIALPRLPGVGETVSEGTLLVNHGGKGANQAVAARRLGADTRLVGCVGDDASGRAVRAALAAEGIGVDGLVTTDAAATGAALIVVDAQGRNQIAVAPGANRRLTIAEVTGRAGDFAWAEVVVVSLEVPLATARWVVEEARRRHVITILNPAPLPDAPLDFLGSVDYLTPNTGEAARLAGIAVDDDAGAQQAAMALRARGVGTAVITLGDRGVLALGAGGEVRIPAHDVAAIDTTAAGDAFNGALAVALAGRRPLADSLAFANAAAALTCTRRGAQPSLPTREEVERLLAAKEGET